MKTVKRFLNEFPEEDFQNDSVYKNLREKYNRDLLLSIESDETKIQNFYDFVLPSLAIQIVIKRISPFPRFVCRFNECDYDGVSCVNKQAYIRHLMTKHEHELPAGGSFLSKSKNFQEGGFTCTYCNASFKRQDHFKIHFSRCKASFIQRDHLDIAPDFKQNGN